MNPYFSMMILIFCGSLLVTWFLFNERYMIYVEAKDEAASKCLTGNFRPLFLVVSVYSKINSKTPAEVSTNQRFVNFYS